MCGIGGWIGRQDGADEVADHMREALHHRGTDYYGVQLDFIRPGETVENAFIESFNG